MYFIRLRLLYSALRQKFSLLELTDKGELNTCISSDPNFVVHFPTNVLNTIFSSIVKAVVGVMMMVIISWQLSVVFFAILPAMILIGYLYGRISQPLSAKVLRKLGDMGTLLYDVLLNTRIIKLHHRERDEFASFKAAANDYYRITVTHIKLAVSTLHTDDALLDSQHGYQYDPGDWKRSSDSSDCCCAAVVRFDSCHSTKDHYRFASRLLPVSVDGFRCVHCASRYLASVQVHTGKR